MSNACAAAAMAGQSEEDIIRGYEPTLKRLAARYRLPPHRRADVEQVGRVAALLSARSFDPTRGVKFSTYAYRGVTRAIRDEALSLPNACDPSADGDEYELGLDRHDADGSDVGDVLAIRRWLSTLPARDEALVRLVHYESRTPADAARALGISRWHAIRLLAGIYAAARREFMTT